MIPCQELADDRWAHFAPSTKARPDAVVRTPQQSAERRARARVMGLGDLRRPGDRLDREASHRVRRSAPAPVGALLPLIFWEQNMDKGLPAPQSKRAAELCLVIAGPSQRVRAKRGPMTGSARSAESITPKGTDETPTERH